MQRSCDDSTLLDEGLGLLGMTAMGPRLLEGRRAVVTGAARGIGRAVLEAFREAGAATLGADISSDVDIRCDVTDPDEVVELFDEAQRRGPLTDVVHAAGVAALGPVSETSLAEWRRLIDVNLTGTFLILREAASRLESGATITVIGSQAGLRGGANWGAYVASKFGVHGLTQCLAQELAPRGIRVNVVAPGNVDTRMAAELIREQADWAHVSAEEIRKEYCRNIPLGRFAAPGELANVCVFLASPLASYVAGSVISVDGGELS
jgi:NAD(P)-dependent dehydrogenase (short-subunit alcohol dehydrogenase family)